MPNLGPAELIVLLIIILIIFGVGRLPEVGGALGKGIREFRRASSGADEIEDKPTEDRTEDKS
ncbi:MAG: twin-arginine translocase TatA/TatE family subunit [Anaerolineae bacterium]